MIQRRRKHLLAKYSHLSFFSQWSEEDLVRLDRTATELEFEPGEIVSRDVMSGQEFVVLVVGHAVVNGGPTHGVAVNAGDHLGELAMFSDASDKAVLIADSYCRALVLSAADFRSLLHTTPSFGRVLSSAMAKTLAPIIHGATLPTQRVAVASIGRTRL